MKIQSLLRVAAVGAAACAAVGAAQAQSAGAWLVRAGAMNIAPDVKSGDLSAPAFAGTKADVKSASQVGGGITYMLTDNWSVDLPLALPFKHELVGDGAIAGVGKIGEVKALPASLFGQYRFGAPSAQLRPYAGLGITYAKFFKERSTAALTALTGGTPANPTTLKVESKLTASVQLGATLALKDRWSLDAAVVYTPLKTRATLSTGQTLDMTLNPTALSLGVAYRF